MDSFHIHLFEWLVELVIVCYQTILFFHINLNFFIGITHTEMTQSAFIRSLGRFLFETKAIDDYDPTKEYTIDQLYQSMYPTWTMEEIERQTYPLKSILDIILSENAAVDFDQWTKKLSAAHFDSEAFMNGSRRILQIRRTSTSASR